MSSQNVSLKRLDQDRNYWKRLFCGSCVISQVRHVGALVRQSIPAYTLDPSPRERHTHETYASLSLSAIIIFASDKFKPSSIPSNNPGTLTLSTALTSSYDAKEVQIHLQASSKDEIHGFTGKIDPSTTGGLRRGWAEGEKEGAGGKDVVLAWDDATKVCVCVVG